MELACFEKEPFKYTPKVGCGYCGALYTVDEKDIELDGKKTYRSYLDTLYHWPSFDCNQCKKHTNHFKNPRDEFPIIVAKRMLKRTRGVYLNCDSCNVKYYPEDTELVYASCCLIFPLCAVKYRLYNCVCGHQNVVPEFILPRTVLNRLSNIRVKKK
jgi:hypothetical protein